MIIDIYSRYVPGWMLAHAENATPGRGAARRHRRQAEHRPRPADHPRRPRLADDRQARRVPARRPRRHQVALAGRTAQQRQPVQRKPVPHPQVPARVPRPLRLLSRTPTPSAAGSSAGTTTSTVTPASGSTRPPTSTTGEPKQSASKRAVVLDAAYASNPERFVRKPPQPPALPTAVWINEPKEDPATTQ